MATAAAKEPLSGTRANTKPKKPPVKNTTTKPKATNGTQPQAPPWHIPLRSETVAVVGFAPSSIALAPYGDPSVEIWGVNELYVHPQVPRVDRLFELHDYKHLTQKQRNPKHLEWLRNATIPIYMLERFADIPRSIEFPWREIVQFCQTDYFTNSISWLLAFAVMEGARRIEMYGVDMARQEEYETQRPSVEYFVGWARGRGVEVVIPPQSDICLTSSLYGIHDHEAVRLRAKTEARKKELNTMIANKQSQIRAEEAHLNQLIGAHQEVMHQERAYQPLNDARWEADGSNRNK